MKLFFLFLLFCSQLSFGQSILEDESSLISTESNSSLVEEKIEKISLSKRILLISNQNGSIGPGDFFSIIYENELVNRALAVKSHDGSMAIKTIKIYSLDLWKKIEPGKTVQILKGDDSTFRKIVSGVELEKKAKVLSDEQLFDEKTLLEDDLSLKASKNRLISSDSLLGLTYGSLSSKDNVGADKRYSHYSARYAYQFTNNIWSEVHIGHSTVDDFPRVDEDANSGGLSTSLTSITLRVKYTIGAPFYSYVLPYVGFQIIQASSDGAGEAENSSTAQQELNQVASLEEKRFVFGATFLKRLVPGWFITGDLGIEVISFGLSLEF